MGSGKSSTGRKIASSLLWNFVDIDKIIEEQEGASVADIFEQRGEDYFRKVETMVLQNVSQRSRTVIACGGGTPCSAENMNIMKSSGMTVYLKLPPGALAARLLKSRTKRPLLRDIAETDMTEKVREMLDKRAGWYDQADMVIDGMKETLEEMTSAIAGLVRSRGAYL